MDFNFIRVVKAGCCYLGLAFSFLYLFSQNVFAGRPFETEPAEIGEKKSIKIDFGVDYSHLGVKEDLLAVPWIGFNFSTGHLVELQAYYNFLFRFKEGENSVQGSGDLTLWTKVGFLSEKSKLPALGLRFGVKLPDANDEKGLGSDETDFYASLLASKTMGKFDNHLNLGIDLAYSMAKVTLFDQKMEAGGAHAALLVGYHW